MKKTRLVSLVSIGMFTLTLATAGLAEARMGGGRTFGSRGTRSVAPRTSPGFGSGGGFSSPYRAAPTTPQQQPSQNPYGRVQPTPAYNTGGGGFMRGMLGGLAGGFLGSMLFRSMGWGAGSGYGYGAGGGGIGLLEILLFGALAFFALRWVMGRAAAAATTAQAPSEPTQGWGSSGNSYGNSYEDRFGTGVPPQGAYAGGADPEFEAESALRRYDASFSAGTFKNARTDDFFKIQAAWMNRDLGRVRELFTDELATQLGHELERLKSEGRINRLENIAVRDSRLVEAWQERGLDYATLWLKANVLDYTVEEQSGRVVSGSNTDPVPFEEYWTYCRPVGSPGAPWKLSAIEQVGNA